MQQTQTQETQNASTQPTSSDWITPETNQSLESKLRESEATQLLDKLEKLLCSK